MLFPSLRTVGVRAVVESRRASKKFSGECACFGEQLLGGLRRHKAPRRPATPHRCRRGLRFYTDRWLSALQFLAWTLVETRAIYDQIHPWRKVVVLEDIRQILDKLFHRFLLLQVFAYTRVDYRSTPALTSRDASNLRLKMPPPKGWDLRLPYLTTPTHSKLLTKDQLASLKTNSPSLPQIPSQATQVPYSSVKITSITTPSHPASGQSGLFATRSIKPGAFVLLYLGNFHPEADPSAASSDYDLWLDREAGVAVDAQRCGNEARFVNDYRGVGSRPNAEFREVWSARHGQRCMAVFALPEGKRDKKGGVGIGKGEEILVSYGKGFWGHRFPEEAAE